MSKKTQEGELTPQFIQADKMAALGLLVAGVAHEINTPMGAIHSNNDNMRRAVAKIRKLLGPQEQEVERLFDIVDEVCRNNEAATERIMKIVHSLKNFARLDEAERKEVDIHEGIESTLTLVQHQLKNRIRVERQFADLPEIQCHPIQLNQVFMNILVNAAHAIPDQGTITIKTLKEGGNVKVVIGDTGVGIPHEHLSKIFDPGFTTGSGHGAWAIDLLQDRSGPRW